MPFQKDVIVVAQGNIPFDRLIWRKRVRGLKTLQIASAPHFHGDRQFVSIQGLGVLPRLRTVFRRPTIFLRIVGISVDELHHKIAVCPGSGSEQRRGQRPGDGDVMVERRAHERQNIGAAIHKALIGDFPRSPIPRRIRWRNGPLAVRDGISRIRNIFAIGLRALGSGGGGEGQRAIRVQI